MPRAIFKDAACCASTTLDALSAFHWGDAAKIGGRVLPDGCPSPALGRGIGYRRRGGRWLRSGRRRLLTACCR